MESPSYSGPVKKKSNVGLIVGIIVAVLFLCCGVGGFGLFKGFKSVLGGASPMFVCGTSMSDYRDAIIAYSKKHGGKLPPAATWEDDVQPFLTHTKIPKILQGDRPVSTGDEVCDATVPSEIYYNSSLAGKTLSSLDPADEQIVLFEAKGTGRNKSQKFEVQPFEASGMMIGQHRGWIQQPLYGTGFLINQAGQRAPVVVVQQTGTGASSN